MNIIPVVCLGILCLLMAVMYTLFGQKTGWQGLLVRGLAVLSCIILSLVSANLKAINNALPLFTIIGMSLLVLSEALKVADFENKRAELITFGILNSVGFVCIALGGMTLAEFNIFAILGGIFLGVACGLILCAIKKYKKIERVLVEIFSFMSMGFILGFGLMAILSSAHIYSGICMLVGGILLIAQKFLHSLDKGGKVVLKIANAMYIVSLAVIALSIYLY